MSHHTAIKPSPSWRAIADCIDAYEEQSTVDFPDLRRFLDMVEPEDRRVALIELIQVEMERRWKKNQARLVEQYLHDFPELTEDSSAKLELYRTEYELRKRCGESPSEAEFRSRFAGFRMADSEGELSDPRNVATRPLTESQTTREMKIINVIGRYRVLGELGKGTFGVVYHCTDDLLHRDVAVKVMRPEASAEPVAALLHEAQGAARLRHPAIVQVLDTGQTEDGRAYIVFEHISGRTLKSRLEDETHGRTEAIRWIADIADALHYAHKSGIVHRDVKPANILIDDDGCAHLTDFGLAKIDDRFVTEDTGRPVGTYCYMSPEQARGQSHWASPQSDVYSLGVILYEVLTGRRPFIADSISSLRSQVVRRPPTPPRTIDDSIPKELETVCLRAMGKEPSDRYRTAADFASDLRAASAASAAPSHFLFYFGLMLLAVASMAVVAFVAGWRPFNTSAALTPAASTQPSPPASGSPRVYHTFRLHRPDKGGGLLAPEHEPLRPGDGLNLKLYVEPAGYVYVVLYTSSKTEPVEILYPTPADEQVAVSNLSVPDVNSVFEMAMDGPEMVLIAASQRPLSAAELEDLKKLTPPALDKKYEALWQHPRREHERTRAVIRRIEGEDPRAEAFGSALEGFFSDDFFVKIFSGK